MIKNIINKFFEFFGFKVIGNRKIVKHNDFDSIIKFVLNNFENKDNFIFLMLEQILVNLYLDF